MEEAIMDKREKIFKELKNNMLGTQFSKVSQTDIMVLFLHSLEGIELSLENINDSLEEIASKK